MSANLKLEIIRGPEGDCIYLNDYRITGPKPWGGGKVIRTFSLTMDDLISAVPGLSYLPYIKPTAGPMIVDPVNTLVD